MLEKKQKSSREPAISSVVADSLAGEFKPFREDAATDFVAQPGTRSGTGDFGLPEQFWRWLDSDSELKAQFEQMIEKRVTERVSVQFDALRPKLEEEAKGVGYQAGYESGMKAAAECMGRLDSICREVVAERADVLKEHEKHWLRAMKHILERLMIHKGTDVVSSLEQWVSEGIMQFEQSGTIRVHLSTPDYEAFSKAGGFSRGKHWELIEDQTLTPGEIHCECGDGGFVFKTAKEMAKLDAWMDRYLATAETSPAK